MRLNLLYPVEILLSKLKGLLWIVFKLDWVLVSNKVLTWAKSTGNSRIALFFPATSITFDGWTIGIWLASDFNPLRTTATVNSQFSFARGLRAWFIRMARVHTLMAASFFQLKTALTTTICHQLLDTAEATTCRMTDFLAFVTTLKLFFADLTAVGSASMTKDVSH